MDILENQIREGTTSHSYIFESKDLGLAMAEAKKFAESLMDEDSVDKAMVRDLISLEAERNTIKIESVRQMIDFFQTRPFHGKYKFAIIEDGAKLGLAASNAMLKILEELPTYGKIIILVKNANEVLETIRSRCQLVKFDSRETYDLDVAFIQGLVESFLYKDFTAIIRNREKIEEMKGQGRDFFAIMIDYMMELRLKGDGKNTHILEKAIDRALEISSNLNNNVNFLLSLEYFALGFLE